MRTLSLILALTPAASTGWLLGRMGHTLPVTSFTSRPSLERVRELADLVTLEVPIADVQVTTLEGATGGVSIVLIVYGDVQYVCDLKQARLKEIDETGQKAVIHLPLPKPQRPRLNHDKTHVYRIDRFGLWSFAVGEVGEAALISEAMAKAQQIVGASGADARLIEQAKKQVETVTSGLYRCPGWDITVRWEIGK